MDNTEIISNFLNGRDPLEHIVSIECGYDDDQVSIIYVNSKGQKRVKLDGFRPFVWVKSSVAVRMFDGDRSELKKQMLKYGIGIRALANAQKDGGVAPRLEGGYKCMFYAKKNMSYQQFLRFFNLAKTPIYEKKLSNDSNIRSKEFLSVSPVEQYMISTGKRFFKGYENYDELKRLQFDLETQGLDPKIHGIDQIGVRTNKGLERVISIEGEGKDRDRSELEGIIEFVKILSEEKPDIIAGHNSENFDWNFIIERCKQLGTTLEEVSSVFFVHPIYKRDKETVLKLGGEVEYYKPTIMWGYSVVDSLHAVRRAQAIDSSMKLANLKYVTKYLNLNKENRVYVPGGKIGDIWRETDEKGYAFNNTNGEWYKITESRPIADGYEYRSGKYIVERYLLDDIWETDKVELKLNEANFLIAKMLPTTFQRACTMGTAGIWKLIMLAWCFEHNLAVPAFAPSQSFTGGLSRLLKTGYADNVVKLDYNSLYPSIILTWNLKTDLDITNSMLLMLEYVLTQREKYKELKKKAGKKAKAIRTQLDDFVGSDAEKHKLIEEMRHWESEASANDKKQLPLKILANSFFGSFGAANIFPFGDVIAAEATTCIGRMCLRLMISHFTNLGYTPIVGDSVTGDTPLYVKYDESGLIDIKPISEIINESNIQVDEFGREYDTSSKKFKVLCRSGWSDVNYVYRHKTNKDIFRVIDGKTVADVTEDHSLFDSNSQEIKPSKINKHTHLEYYYKPINDDSMQGSDLTENQIVICAKMLANGTINRVPIRILNSSLQSMKKFINVYDRFNSGIVGTKTAQAGLLFLRKQIG